MTNSNRHNKYVWPGVGLAAILPIVWFATSHYFQSSTPAMINNNKIVNRVVEESNYIYIDKSESQMLDAIKSQYPFNAYKLQIEKQKESLQEKFKNPDIVEQIALERELTLLQVKIDNYRQYYDEKVRLLLEAFQTLKKFRNDFSPNEYNSAQTALINGDTGPANQLLTKVDAKYRVTLGGDGIDRAAEAVYQQGKISEEQMDYRKAYRYYRQAVRYDPGNIKYLVDAGKVADSIALYGKAIVFYEAALHILRTNKGAAPYEIRDLLINLGQAWSSKGEMGKAIEYFELALAKDIDTVGRMHINVAEDLNYLGSAWESNADKQKAIKYYRQAVELYETELGKTHPTTLLVRENLKRLM